MKGGRRGEVRGFKSKRSDSRGGGGSSGGSGGGGGGGWGGKGNAGRAKDKREKGKEHEGVEIGNYVGTVKSFNDKTAYGFIDCPDLKEEYNHDVFLLGTDRNGANVGDGVSFTAFLNNMGKPQAKDLEVTSQSGGGGGAKRQRQNEAGGWGWSGGGGNKGW
mmetsp:Transcript_57451/g.122216  ORF Transcript_57451/g.122216 Transcript_57451/m.122216 type:complete len:161 (+) Transcript_57451:168-650(+)